MTYLIFAIVMACLMGIARVTKLTYNTVNILVYYLLIPLSWAWMVDKIAQWELPWLTITWATVWAIIFIATCRHFQTWCDRIFIKSVDFLMWFNRFNWNYCMASVYICVWLPLIIYAMLIGVFIHQHPFWHWQPWILGIVVSFSACWLVWWFVMSFGVKLVPHTLFTLVSYPLTSDEEQKVATDTRGMNTEQILKYAFRQVKNTFSYSLYPTGDDDASCVGYAMMFTSIVNTGFQANGIEAKAYTVEGTAKVFGIDICKLLGRIFGSMLSAHKFVQISTPIHTYCVDPTIYAIFGYKFFSADSD